MKENKIWKAIEHLEEGMPGLNLITPNPANSKDIGGGWEGHKKNHCQMEQSCPNTLGSSIRWGERGKNTPF